MRITVVLLFLLGCSQISLHSQSTSQFADMEISLLSCRNGDELYNTFGHTALRLYNPNTEADIVYNYGTFDFNTPYFYIKFLQGKLPYKLAASTMSRFMREYQYEERSVLEQKLSLTAAEKEQIFRKLADNIKPENKFYKYDFFFDNCTTRTMDLITLATGKPSYDKAVTDITFRNMLKQNLQSLRWSEFGIDLVIGAVADEKASRTEQFFLPLHLHAGLNSANLSNGTPLVSSDQTILDFEDRERERKTPSTNWPFYLALLLLAIEAILFFRGSTAAVLIYDKGWMWLMAILGLVMTFMWFGTDHLATKQNYNVLWASPLFLVLLFAKSPPIKKWMSILLIALCSLAFVNCVVQILPQYFHPAFACFAAISVLKLVRSLKKPQLSA